MSSDPIRIVDTSEGVSDPVRLVSITQKAANMIANAINLVTGFVIGNLIFVFTEDQLPDAIGGNITLEAGKNYFSVGDVEVNANLIIPDEGNVQLSGASTHSFIQNVPGTFITCADLQARFTIDSVTIKSNTGGTLFDISSTPISPLAEVLIFLSELSGFSDVGSIDGVSIVTGRVVFLVDYSTGLTISDCATLTWFDGGFATFNNVIGLTVNIKSDSIVIISNNAVVASNATHCMFDFLEGAATGYGLTVSGNNKGKGDFLAVGSLDRTNINVNFHDNTLEQDSANIGAYFINDNVGTTTITGSGAWNVLNINPVTDAINIERWSVFDSSTGEIEYIGLEDFAGIVQVSFAALKTGGAVKHKMRIFKTTAGTPIQATTPPFELATVLRNVSFNVSITMKTGERIRPEISRLNLGTTAVTIEFLSFTSIKS